MARSRADWKAIRAEYEGNGDISVHEIAEKFGISHTAINKRVAADGWVKGEGHGGKRQGASLRVEPLPTVFRPVPESARPAEEEDFHTRARREIEIQLTELEEARRYLASIEDSISEEAAGDRNGRRRSMMLKAVSLPTRAAVLKTLTQALVALNTVDAGKGGKKEQRKEAAEKVGVGRFATPTAPTSPPRLLVVKS